MAQKAPETPQEEPQTGRVITLPASVWAKIDAFGDTQKRRGAAQAEWLLIEWAGTQA